MKTGQPSPLLFAGHRLSWDRLGRDRHPAMKIGKAGDGRRVRKTLLPSDREKLREAVSLCADLFARLDIPADGLFLGTLNAGHPGGMMPLTPAESRTLHHERLPGNVSIADASLFPSSLGRPPILTIMALAITIARRAVS